MTTNKLQRSHGHHLRGQARRRSEAIYTTLRDRICFLQYPPGTKLSEISLAAEFDVSRTPIRRILQRLEFEKLAERRQGAPTVVTDYNFESLQDIYAIRMILAENMDQLSPADAWWRRVGVLQRLQAECRRLKPDPDLQRLGAVHLNLQEELALVVRNQRARDIMMQLYIQIARIWLSLVPAMTWADEVDHVDRELDAIIDAMAHRDIRGVGLVRRNYIAMNIARMRAIMDTSGSSTSDPNSPRRLP